MTKKTDDIKTHYINWRKVWTGAIRAVLVLLVATLVSQFQPAAMIKACGGLIDIDMLNMVKPSPVEYADTINQGVYVKYNDLNNRRSILNWTSDDAQFEKMNLRPNREVFTRTLNIRFRSVLSVILNAGCRYTGSGNKKNLGLVMARISIDGRSCGKDSQAMGGVNAVIPLYSSAGCIQVLEPGEYQLIAEGIFAGCVDNHDASLQLAVIRYQDISYKQYKEALTTSHRWLRLSSAQEQKKELQKVKTELDS